MLIAGAGIAGSSLAFELAARRSVILLKREAQPGYGTPAVRAPVRRSIPAISTGGLLEPEAMAIEVSSLPGA